MKIDKKSCLLWGLPVIFIVIIGLLRLIPSWAEVYARVFYPVISASLSALSALFPFSVGDCFIVGACLWLIGYPFYAWWKKKKVKQVLGKMIRFIMWVYIWFYFAWGLNYFRLSFYERAGVTRAEFSTEKFQTFLFDYIGRLNDSYYCVGDTLLTRYAEPFTHSCFLRNMNVDTLVQEGYRKIASRFALVTPGKNLRVKPMLWSKGMSGVAVTGYMGPFFAEFNLNQDLLNIEYPFTYAHELAHRLGIAGEAEANLYAYLVTTGATKPEIRFSGYFSMLGYVMNNARRLLTEEQFREISKQIRPEIAELYNKHLMYWREKYNPGIGQVQNKVYNAYLKGNQVNTGTKNYSEVVGLLMALQN